MIQPELMLFGLLSLLMGHWIIFVAKVCVKSSALSARFYPCAPRNVVRGTSFGDYNVVFRVENLNTSYPSELERNGEQKFCPEVASLQSYLSLSVCFSIQFKDCFFF